MKQRQFRGNSLQRLHCLPQVWGMGRGHALHDEEIKGSCSNSANTKTSNGKGEDPAFTTLPASHILGKRSYDCHFLRHPVLPTSDQTSRWL